MNDKVMAYAGGLLLVILMAAIGKKSVTTVWAIYQMMSKQYDNPRQQPKHYHFMDY